MPTNNIPKETPYKGKNVLFKEHGETFAAVVSGVHDAYACDLTIFPVGKPPETREGIPRIKNRFDKVCWTSLMDMS